MIIITAKTHKANMSTHTHTHTKRSSTLGHVLVFLFFAFIIYKFNWMNEMKLGQSGAHSCKLVQLMIRGGNCETFQKIEAYCTKCEAVIQKRHTKRMVQNVGVFSVLFSLRYTSRSHVAHKNRFSHCID